MVVGSLVGALDFAADLGAPVVRVFPGAPVEPGPYDQVPQLLQPREEVDARAASRLTAVAGYAEDRGVLPRTGDPRLAPTGRQVAAVLEQVDGAVARSWT
jgi:sugar phosphate isomerase/epimerase